MKDRQVARSIIYVLQSDPTIEDGILSRVESRLSISNNGGPLIYEWIRQTKQSRVGHPPSPHSLSSDSMRPRLRKKRNGSSRGRAKSPNQTATPPANTDSDEDEEQALPLKDGSATSPRSPPRSPWTTDESSDLESHADNTESSRVTLTSIREKDSIQYPITPESSLVCAKEEPLHLDPSLTGPDGLPMDLVSGTLSHVHDQALNWVFSMLHGIQQPLESFY